MSNEDATREAFIKWALEKELAFRNAHGLWFYPAYSSTDLWLGWQAREAEIQQLCEERNTTLAERNDTFKSCHGAEQIISQLREKLTIAKAQALLEAADDIEDNRIIYESFSHWLRERAEGILEEK